MPDPAVDDGWVDAELAAEFPELGVVTLTLEARSGGRSPQAVRERLALLASRITGGRVVHMRQDTVPWAYRVFWRQIGIDPDTERTPVEQIALDRLKHGGFRSRNVLDDAIVVATLETGVPVVAFDSERIGENVGLRTTAAGESLGPDRPLSTRQIVYCDEHRPLALVSGEVSAERGVTPDTTQMTLAALSVKGVPRISVEEALWTVADTVGED
jgi:DNA/RNA-binding domain of Phe-tRNA-synthetase-like protein